MSYTQKPKRRPVTSDQHARRNFYWQLFQNLIVPALVLSLLFMVPALFIAERDSSFADSCTRLDGDAGVRIHSDVDYITYHWTTNAGDRWQKAMQIRNSSPPYIMDCNTLFINESVIVMAHPYDYPVAAAIVKSNNRIERFQVDGCDSLNGIELVEMNEDTIQLQFQCRDALVMEFAR